MVLWPNQVTKVLKMRRQHYNNVPNKLGPSCDLPKFKAWILVRLLKVCVSATKTLLQAVYILWFWTSDGQMAAAVYQKHPDCSWRWSDSDLLSLLALFGVCTCTCPLLPAKWLWQRGIQHPADVISATCSSSFSQLPACYTQETWWFMVSALLSQNGPRDQLKWWQTVGSVETKSSYWG